MSDLFRFKVCLGREISKEELSEFKRLRDLGLTTFDEYVEMINNGIAA